MSMIIGSTVNRTPYHESRPSVEENLSGIWHNPLRLNRGFIFNLDFADDQYEDDEGEDEVDDDDELDEEGAQTTSKRKGTWFYIRLMFSLILPEYS